MKSILIPPMKLLNDISGKLKNLEEYSTTERVIGKWVNGKPLYEKTISFPGNTTSIAHGVSPEHLWIESGFVYAGQYGCRPVDLASSYCDTTDLYLLYASEGWKTYPGYVVIRYTKTTDS